MKIKKVLLVTMITLGTVLTPLVVSAASDTDNTVITANIASVITMTTSGTVAINITPTGSGAASSASDTVTISTNHSAGYNLVLKDSDTTLTLTKGGDTIANHTGTFASPSTLANNSWGYRVDGAGTFGSGPTSAETNQANLAGTWAGIKSSSVAGDTLKTTATTAANDVTTVWYGVKADTTKPNGAYTNTVTYTATTN